MIQDISIRELKKSDAQSLFDNYSCDIEAGKYRTSLPHKNVAYTRERIAQWQLGYEAEAPKLLVYGVASTNCNDTIFGLLVLVFPDPFQRQSAEIHFGLSLKTKGQGLGTLVCQKGLEILNSLGVKKVSTASYKKHLASIRVLDKCGFKHHGTLKQHAKFPVLGEGLFDCADMRLELSKCYFRNELTQG